ncbi:tRNA dimethylallyltransferase [Pseudoclavibacter triregionum]|nr:tRNA dimethylallyltransferase [Pseudoclavibacter triregionum]
MLLVIAGATATGKTELSLDVAERLIAAGIPAEVVNGDAMQLYRGMEIGTAKAPVEERRGIPHHLFDLLDVREESTVAAYQEAARGVIDEILGRGAVPILVGGSGLYLAAVLFDLRFPGADPEVRAKLERELEEWGPGMLHKRLRAYDPVSAERIDPRNGRRIVRALEAIAVTGEPFSASLPDQESWWRETTMVLLEEDRAVLTERLDRRVERMWADGLLEETAGLLERGLEEGVTARRAIGYAQAIAELRGEQTREEAIAEAQLLTRKYARRQVSWFRRYETALRLRAGDPRNAELTLRAAGFGPDRVP